MLLAFTAAGSASGCQIDGATDVSSKSNSTCRHKNWTIRQGKFYADDQWVFLKVAKPLRNYADADEVDQLIADLDIFESKNYNCLEINCYWHHFDIDGDGLPDKSLAPLNKLIDAIYARGMFPCLTVETYAVGGGEIPETFWARHPDARAIDPSGDIFRDDEYGFDTRVPSIFSPDYRQATRRFIKAITEGVDTGKILFYETTVEPQYMGNRHLCFSDHARQAYSAWLKKNKIEGPLMPETFPIPENFCTNEIWNRFRAEFLADWVNEDAAVFRQVAGADAYVAVDYLETAGDEMDQRNGDSLIFLRNLTSANIIQVNWHWHIETRSTNMTAYQNLTLIMKETGRDWAIAEHMTLNGSDFHPDEVPGLLNSTITHGSGFGWDFVDVAAESHVAFSLYHDDWSPKPPMAVVDNHWEDWMKKMKAQQR